MKENILSSIEQFVSMGFYLFPVDKNKKALKTDWENEARNDICIVKSMLENRERKGLEPQLAIACGPSGLFVLDVDVKNGKNGYIPLEALEAKYGQLPATVTVSTPNHGEQLYFRGSGKTTRDVLGEGLDTRSKGGYVVCPPSVLENGKAYTWAEGRALGEIAIAEAPQWLLGLTNVKAAVPKKSASEVDDVIPDGTRNDTLYREACSLRAKGLDDDQILGAIAVMNERRCQPPLEDAEVFRLVESACKYEPGKSTDKKTAGRPKKDVAALEAQMQGYGLGSFTDTGNARRLVRHHGENLRYTGQFGWLVWDRMRWICDDTGQVERFCKDTAERIQGESWLVDPDEEKDLYTDILRHANSSLNQARLDAMKKNASTEAEIRIRHSVLDANPWLFNIQNGTLDLQDGTLRPHNRTDHITKLASVRYEPDIRCPQWFAFLDQTFQGDWDLIRYLQRVFGYALTGAIAWQCLFLLHGSGQNGKSVLLDVLRLLVGDYGAQTDFNTFMVKRNNDTTRNDLAQLVNRRVVCGSEGDIGQHISEALIKQVTGEKRVNACFKYKEPFEYDVTFKVFLATNHLPNITGQDKGIWRRLRVIPFRYQVPDDQREPRLIEEKFVPELSGILNWALEGCREWLEDGEHIPRAVVEATAQYREDMDPFGQFLQDCFELDDPSAETATETILEMLKKWSSENHPPLAQTTGKGLAVKMAEKGIEKSSNKNKRGYRGLHPKYLAERKYTKSAMGLNVHDYMASLN